MNSRRALAGVVLTIVAGCGGGGPADGSVSTASVAGAGAGPADTAGQASAAGNFVITIANLRFSPLDLMVPAGATVTVVNDDDEPHSVTSEATRASYTPGAVNGVSFDTGEFSSGRRTFTIAANAMAGTVVPYYSSTDASAMATPDGTITVAGSPAATTMLPSVPLPVVIHSETIGALPATTAP